MKKIIFLIFLFVFITFANAEYIKVTDFQFKKIEFNHLFYSFTISSTVAYFSHDFYLNLGFTKEEAKYYAMFTGIVAGLVYEYFGNYKKNPIRRESNFMGIGLSIVVMRW